MGRLAGFTYRQIVRKLRSFGFNFDRQAAGSHEIWFNPNTDHYVTIPNHPGDMPEGTFAKCRVFGIRDWAKITRNRTLGTRGVAPRRQAAIST